MAAFPRVEGQSFGFLGVGTINSAIIRGICALPPSSPCLPKWPLFLSPRNAAKARELLAEHGPDKVAVASSNQDLLDRCEVVFLGLTPPVADAQLPGLKFRSDHAVVNLVSTLSAERLREHCGGAVGTGRIVKAVPLPGIARHAGAVPIFPPEAEGVARFFAQLGTAVPVASEEQLRACQATTCLMGPYYELLRTAQAFLVREGGVDEAAAGAFVGAMMAGVATDSKEASAATFAEKVAEQTPGGLNEGAIARLRAEGAYRSVDAALEATLDRLKRAAGVAAPADREPVKRPRVA